MMHCKMSGGYGVTAAGVVLYLAGAMGQLASR
jgi:hypothetical protein